MDDDLNLPRMENSVLVPSQHEALIKNIWGYADAAGLAGNPEYIWESVLDKDYVSKKDQEFFANILKLRNGDKKAYGIIYTGSNELHQKFMAGTGLLVRNHLNAVYMPMAEVYQVLMDSALPVARILFIPDAFTAETEMNVRAKDQNKSSVKFGEAKKEKKPLTAKAYEWKKDLLNYLLVKRQAENYPTVISISNLDIFESFYGHELTRFLKENYIVYNVRED